VLHCRTLPECNTEDVTTGFGRLPGPGFFPVHDGHFDGCRVSTSPRVVFFGADWGTLEWYRKCARDLDSRGQCGCPTSPTDRRLRGIVQEAGLDPCVCHLTNSVLALADIESATQTYHVYRNRQYRSYLERCGEYHERWLKDHTPRLAVIMGAPNLELYAPFIWPELFRPGAAWHRATLGKIFAGDDPERWTDVVTADSGLSVLAMYHPSFMHANPRGRSHRKAVWRRTVAQLQRYGAGAPA
jgi:hypothetical protein